MSRVPCRISMRLRYGSRLGIVSSRQSTTAELGLVDVLLDWTRYPSPPPAVSLRRRWNRTVEAPAMHMLTGCRHLADLPVRSACSGRKTRHSCKADRPDAT